MAKVIINQEPGSTWTNAGETVQYQLLVSWQNSCGLCVQYDRAIGPLWPTPFHRGCRCKQKALWPGVTSEPFVDFRAKITTLNRVQQSRVIGRSNLVLVEAGVVQWDDVVTKTRVRTLQEVVSRKRLAVDVMTNAGVVKRLAEQAHQAVNTPAHAIAEAQRVEAIRNLQRLSVGKESIQDLFAERMAGRLGISAKGPSGPSRFDTIPTHEEAYRVLIALGIKPSALVGQVETEKKAERTDKAEPGKPDELIADAAAKPAEFVAKVSAGLEAGLTFSDEVLALYRQLKKQ